MTSEAPFHQESFFLNTPPAQIRNNITNPCKVGNYFPLCRGGQTVENGRSLIMHGLTGACLIEVIEESENSQYLRLRVSSALLYRQPITAQMVRQKAFFVMDEVYRLLPEGQGCRIEKHWLNLHKKRLRFLPMQRIVRLTAHGESEKLKRHW